ncbi:MAG: hypothetical protein HY319_15490 [Armatimonadetes bacterium]|nr:hypothetical protein [Armatimonadota bacterium]
MIHLAVVLHLYQPPDCSDEMLDQVVGKCYRPLLSSLEAHGDRRISLNLNWSMTERLLESRHHDIVEDIRVVVEREQVELTGSAAYHPILPLIPPDEIRRQIMLNAERHRDVFPTWVPRGFFPPELAFGHELPPVLVDLGYRWCLAEDVPYTCINDTPPFNFVPVCGELPVLLRSSLWSNRLRLAGRGHNAPRGHQLAAALAEGVETWFGGRDGYLVVALEAEVFGHRIPGYLENLLEPFLAALESMQERIRLVHPSEIVALFPHQASDIPPGSWLTTADDFWAGDFFPMWQSKYNQAHELLWQLTDLAVHSVARLQEKLDRSLNSSTFWSASSRTAELPEMTARGMRMLLDVIASADPDQMSRALELMARLDSLFEKQ